MHTIGPFNVSQSFLFSAGVVLVVLGTYLQWKLGHHWMQAEERVKDGWLSEDQARRRMTLVRYGGRLMILLGVTAFVAVFWE